MFRAGEGMARKMRSAHATIGDRPLGRSIERPELPAAAVDALTLLRTCPDP
jgi:hypothetical protein